MKKYNRRVHIHIDNEMWANLKEQAEASDLTLAQLIRKKLML